MKSNKRSLSSTAMLISAAFFILISTASCSAQQPQTKGPYLQNLTGRSVTVCWETPAAAAGTITISAAGGKSFTLKETNVSKFHEVKIGSLAPGTVYNYSVSSGTINSGGTFRTDPEKAEPFTFIAYGDCRSGYPMHKQLIKHMTKYNPALVLNTGDLVGDGNKQSEWDMFWSIVEPVVKNAPYYPALGNHEKNADLYYHYFSLPDTGLGEENYSFAYAGAFFVSLDTNNPTVLDQKVLKWLKQQLQAAQKYDFIFVIFHQPLFSSSKRPPALGLRKILIPIFDKYKISAVFNGHDHFYEHCENNGIPYIVTGGGGAELYDFERTEPACSVKSKENHILIVKINGKTATIEARNLNNKLIDSLTLKSPR